MYLHAFVDGSGFWNYAYYIVETEERFFHAGERRADNMETEMLAMLTLLKSPSVIRASGMTVFADAEAVVLATRRPAFQFRNKDGMLERLRVEIKEAIANLPYRPRIVHIEDSYNLAHRVTRNKSVRLIDGSKQPYQMQEGSRRWKAAYGLTQYSGYLKEMQQGISN